jgi:hypothetical protein
MHFTLRNLVFAAVAIAMVVSAGPAMARGYNGSATNIFLTGSENYSGAYPVTITHAQFGNATGCLTLTQAGGNGGSASLVLDGQKYPYGSFLIMSDILMATIQEPLYGQNGALLFVVHASRGLIGRGIFENAEGGSAFNSGDLLFGTKGGC